MFAKSLVALFHFFTLFLRYPYILRTKKNYVSNEIVCVVDEFEVILLVNSLCPSTKNKQETNRTKFRIFLSGEHVASSSPQLTLDVQLVDNPRPPPDRQITTMASTSQKKDDEGGLNQYYHNKTTVIQDARVFNESPISPRKCRALLAQIVYLLYAGETFNTQEATTLFFGVTKLFQHKDVRCLLTCIRNGFLNCYYFLSTECTAASRLFSDQGTCNDG